MASNVKKHVRRCYAVTDISVRRNVSKNVALVWLRQRELWSAAIHFPWSAMSIRLMRNAQFFKNQFYHLADIWPQSDVEMTRMKSLVLYLVMAVLIVDTHALLTVMWKKMLIIATTNVTTPVDAWRKVAKRNIIATKGVSKNVTLAPRNGSASCHVDMILLSNATCVMKTSSVRKFSFWLLMLWCLSFWSFVFLRIVVNKTIDECGHKIELPCSTEPTRAHCQKQLSRELPCGHSSKIGCGLDLDKVQCSFPCKALLECGHNCLRRCHIKDPDHSNYECHKPCLRLKKGCQMKHQCRLKCFEECPPCNAQLKRSLPCGHEVFTECHLSNTEIECS